MKRITLLFGLLYIAIIAFPQSNLVGKKAPKIEIEEWIHPKIKVSDFETEVIPEKLEGRIIVLDFWFTQCAPCVASIPVLNSLAKNYPEILFLSISFEKVKPIEDFLKKMVIHYPVGSDPENRMIDAFGVIGYPETFLIDENGIIQWQGSPFDLNEKILTKVTGRIQKAKTVSIPNPEIKQNNSAYSFTIQEHNLEMEGASYFHYNPFDVNVLNRSLQDILNSFYEINTPRVINRTNIPLETSFDLTLKADKSIMTEANCVEMLRFLLPKELGIEIKEIKIDTLVNFIELSNNQLLDKNLSKENHYGITIRYDNWEANGVEIKDLKNFLENKYGLLVEIEKETNNKYSFVLPINNLLKTKEKLEIDYGIKLTEKRMKSKFWVLE